VGRFVSQDPFSGWHTKPASLNKYVYGDSDPINKYDPTGEFTVNDLNVSMGQIASASRAVAVQFGNGARAGWAAIRHLGTVAENKVKQIVTQCLKPKEFLKPRIKDSRRRLDGIADLGDGLFKWETKANIPKIGSAAIKRLKEQILAYQRSGANEKFHLVIGNKFSKDEMKGLLKYLGKEGVDTGGVKIFNGLVHFSAWIGEAYSVLCLE
jgi:hypothetical protein